MRGAHPTTQNGESAINPGRIEALHRRCIDNVKIGRAAPSKTGPVMENGARSAPYGSNGLILMIIGK